MNDFETLLGKGAATAYEAAGFGSQWELLAWFGGTLTHKIVLSEDTVFELSDEEWNGLIEKGYITDEA